jgi:hypothetical protein
MRLPWVSRRAYELLEQQRDSLISDLKEARLQADRAKDALIDRVGFSPVSSPVRSEIKAANDELEKYIEASQFEDVGAGMISADVLQLADDLADPSTKPV